MINIQFFIILHHCACITTTLIQNSSGPTFNGVLSKVRDVFGTLTLECFPIIANIALMVKRVNRQVIAT